MKHVGWFACACILVTSFPIVGSANDLTDAMTSPDPRTKLESGTGQVYHSRYGDPEEPPPSTLEEPELETPSLRYERSDLYEGLRSPLDEPPSEADNAEELSTESPDALSDDLPPLGKADARPGVWYQDDLQKR